MLKINLTSYVVSGRKTGIEVDTNACTLKVEYLLEKCPCDVQVQILRKVENFRKFLEMYGISE